METQLVDTTFLPGSLPWQRNLLAEILALKQQQRLPQAILIESKSEADTNAFIWQLVMLLLCTKPEAADPCRQCQACQLMLSNTYPDFSFVTLKHDDKTKKLNKNIKIDQIRELIHHFFLTRSYDNLKIAVIYPAEKMNIASANSLLKTLEEPADHSLILLVTHNLGKLPVTIRSRCQTWTLDHPKQQAALGWLQEQGMNQSDAVLYLDYAGADPVLAVELKLLDYATVVDQFKRQFAAYLSNKLDVGKLSSSLVALETPLVRRLVKMVITAYCYQFCGVPGKTAQTPAMQKPAARNAIELLAQIDQFLMVEENNLNLQLQLEDVLISLKRIIQRSNH